MHSIPRHLLATQSCFPDPAKLSGTLFESSIMLGGFVLGSPGGITLAAFVAATEADVETMFTAANVTMQIPLDFSGYIGWDMESPVRPAQWWDGSLGLTDAYFASVAMRFRVLKRLLPNAKIGLYGCPMCPPAAGVTAGNWIGTEWVGYQKAVSLGVFTSCDFLMPVLRAPTEVHDVTSWMTNWTTLGLDYAEKLIPGKPLVPFLAWKATGKYLGIEFPAETLLVQLKLMYARSTIEAIVFWSGNSGEINPITIERLGMSGNPMRGGSIMYDWISSAARK